MVTSNRPVSVFNGLDTDVQNIHGISVQLPPAESLGTQYFIPELPESIDTINVTFTLVLTSSEDSTIDITEGDKDYSYLNSLDLHTQQYDRLLLPYTVPFKNSIRLRNCDASGLLQNRG